MKKVNEQIKKLLEEIGASNIKFYMLVNNDGYTFEYKGVKFDLRHWRNVYGFETNYYSVMNYPRIRKGKLVYPKWIDKFSKELKEKANKILKGDPYWEVA